MSPLNSALYDALQEVFGEVRIANDGEHRRVSYYPDFRNPSRLTSSDTVSGEYYRIKCPYCSDCGFRCWINHEFGELDPKTKRRNLHLWICYNEGCQSSAARREQLFDDLQPATRNQARRLGRRPSAVQHDTDNTHSRPVEIRLPPSFYPISEVRAAEHPALQYLEERNFSPAMELAERWHLRFTSRSPDSSPPFEDARIIIPVFAPGPAFSLADSSQSPGTPDRVLAGWQARSIWTADEGSYSSPKYLSCRGMKKSHILYGLPEAINTRGPVVIVEGVTDVWRLQTNAIALFGKDLSSKQSLLLQHHFSDRPIVVFLDAGTQEASNRAVAAIMRARGVYMNDTKVVTATLPNSRDDVGECSTEEAWDAVAAALGASREALWEEIGFPAPLKLEACMARSHISDFLTLKDTKTMSDNILALRAKLLPPMLNDAEYLTPAERFKLQAGCAHLPHPESTQFLEAFLEQVRNRRGYVDGAGWLSPTPPAPESRFQPSLDEIEDDWAYEKAAGGDGVVPAHVLD
jgi:hypothetical protein